KDPPTDKEISVLDLILCNSQESLDADFISQHSPPSKISSANMSISNTKIIPSSNQFATAALEGTCLICSKSIDIGELLQHLYKHKPGPLRAKCLMGFRTSFPSHKLPIKVQTKSPPSPISTIEKKFREKFPELPVFNKENSSINNSSSSDEDFLIEKLDSPPTGPPKVSPFKKALYSRVVKKGLYRCEFCEKSFITEAGANKHKLQIHKIAPFVTKASFLPDCPPEMCRVCFKGPAPYKLIAEHYKYVHNLEISSNIKNSSTSTISISSQDFVTTDNKHTRSFFPIPSTSTQAANALISKKNTTFDTSSSIQNSYSRALNPNIPVSSSNVISTELKPNPNYKSNSKSQETKIYHNLKIVSRPELRGLGPSKIVAYPSAKPSTKSLPSSTKSNTISVTAEVHHSNSSQDPSLHPSPRKCRLCPFLAIKYCGLRLHYYKEHGLRKVPASHNSVAKFPTQVPQGPQINKNSSSNSKPSVQPPASSLSINNSTKPTPANPKRKTSANKIGITSNSPVINPSSNSRIILQSEPTIRTIPDPVVASSYSSNISTIVPMVSFNNSTLQYSFPLQTRLQCPIENCSASFGTKSWFTTNTSIKKHLNVFHHQKPAKVLYHCSICNNRIAKNPAKHSCLVNNLILPPAVIEGDHWVCDICESFSTISILAKKNHLEAHARETIKSYSSKLIIPPSSKATKKLKSKRVSFLSEGPPGSIPLAPPLSSLTEDPSPLPEDIEQIPKIDMEKISILDSFLDPLEALLEVDDLEEAQRSFDSITNDITIVIQNHFNLSPRSNFKKNSSTSSTRNNTIDPLNAQMIQKQYRWNRRRCIRNLTNPSSSTCQIKKEILTDHFTKTWASPESEFSFPSKSPPSLPPVIDPLSPEAIISCLQSCENSAPGPDRLSYQHWKTVDPR
ncbi:c2H2-type domain-containing protein, partial [Nephila pilipes]